jgi:hypothetical protein
MTPSENQRSGERLTLANKELLFQSSSLNESKKIC